MHSSPPADAPGQRNPALDGLRGVAVLWVFLFHYGGGLRSHSVPIRLFGYLTQAGWIGVELFFALSGFLITGILLDSIAAPLSLRTFYGRRALRILPLYAAALLACAAAATLAGANWRQLAPLLLYAGFLQDLPHLAHGALLTPPPLPLFHLWSLAVEEQFYLLWPYLLMLARTPRRVLLLCLGLFALSFLFRLLLFTPGAPPSTEQAWATCLPTRAGALMLGSGLAGLRRTYPDLRLRHLACGAAAPTCLALLAIGRDRHSFLLQGSTGFRWLLPLVDCLSVALVALCFEPGVLPRLLSWSGLRFFGRISYSFYVLHILCEPVFDYIGAMLSHATTGFAYQTVRMMAALVLTSATATLSYIALERPFLRLKRFLPRASAEHRHPRSRQPQLL